MTARLRDKIGVLVIGMAASVSMHAAAIDTTNAALITAFQAGATVSNFESISGITPLTITSYTNGTAIPHAANLFNQLPAVQFSVGGTPGSFSTEPVVLKLSGGISGDAHSPTNVLAGADMAGNTEFNNAEFIEVYFPTLVSKVGFWLDPGLGNVLLVAKTTQQAFNPGGMESVLETDNNLTAGHFVGIQRPTADIGGLTIIATQASGFALDDFTFGGASVTTATPEPSTWALSLLVAGAAFYLRARFPHIRKKAVNVGESGSLV